MGNVGMAGSKGTTTEHRRSNKRRARVHGAASSRSNRKVTSAPFRTLRRSVAKTFMSQPVMREKGYVRLFKKRRDDKRSLFSRLWKSFVKPIGKDPKIDTSKKRRKRVS